jgi:hypothetical protein
VSNLPPTPGIVASQHPAAHIPIQRVVVTHCARWPAQPDGQVWSGLSRQGDSGLVLRWLPSFFVGCALASILDRAVRSLTVARIPRCRFHGQYAADAMTDSGYSAAFTYPTSVSGVSYAGRAAAAFFCWQRHALFQYFLGSPRAPLRRGMERCDRTSGPIRVKCFTRRGALCDWRVGNLTLDGRVGGPICPPIGTLYGAIMRKLKERLERAHRADYHFAIVSVALMVCLIVAGCTAWMFGN